MHHTMRPTKDALSALLFILVFNLAILVFILRHQNLQYSSAFLALKVTFPGNSDSRKGIQVAIMGEIGVKIGKISVTEMGETIMFR